MSESQPVPSAADSRNPGAALMQARERQGLSRAQLAERLRMRADQIEALECNHQERWPEDVFTIAQVRRLADALDVEVEPLLAAFRLSLKQRAAGTSPAAQAVMQASVQRSTPAPSRDEGRRDWVSSKSTEKKNNSDKGGANWLLPGVLVLAVLAIGGAGLHRLASQGSLKLPALTNLQKLPSFSLPGGHSSAESAVSDPEPVAVAPAPLPKALSVAISNDEKVWLTVKQLNDQKVLFQGLFQGSQDFPLGDGLQVRAGRPDLVLVGLGDQPPKLLGTIEIIKWVTFKPPGANPQAQ